MTVLRVRYHPHQQTIRTPTPGISGSNGNTQTEGRSSILNAASGSMTDGERKIFVWRRWYDIGPDGKEIEE